MDGCIDELEVERGRHRATLERLALADAESSSTRAEAESVRDALSLAIKNFKNLEEFKEKILEGGFASYFIGYEDDRDAVGKLYPDLNLSSIVPPDSEEEATEEGATPIEDDAQTAPGPAPTTEAILE